MPSPRAPEITTDALRELVQAFYDRVRDDAELGPIFDRVVGQSAGGWAPHLEKMTAFWSAVMLGLPGFRGNPREAHARIVDLEPRHFSRWLFLFRLEAHRVFEPEPAQEIVERAEIMAVHLKAAAFASPFYVE